MILQKGGGFVLNVRCRKILADLLNAPYPIPTEILMEKYDVSERSIKYDIGKLRAYLAENAPDVTLAYQARRGFSFEAKPDALYAFQQKMDVEHYFA